MSESFAVPPKKPRILLVTPTHTHPPRQGNSARILSFGREMRRRGYAVDLLYYKIDYWSGNTAIAMRAEWDALHLIEPQPHRKQARASHWGLDDWCPDALVHKVRQLCQQHRYQAVVVNYVWLSRVLEAVDNAVKVIDTHDVFGGRAELALASGVEPSWFFTSPEDEAAGLERADIILAIQNEERDLLASRTHRPVYTVGHPVHATYRPLPATNTAIFGYFASANPWNLASVRALDQELAQTEHPMPWLMAGSICRSELNLQSSPRIMGMVQVPADFYDKVSCVLNPMLAGTGLKIKTVEALAHGRPLIGTREAFRGLESFHPMQSLDTIEGMAGAMTEFASSRALRAELAAACARTYVAYMATTQSAYDDFASLIR